MTVFSVSKHSLRVHPVILDFLTLIMAVVMSSKTLLFSDEEIRNVLKLNRVDKPIRDHHTVFYEN